MFSDDLRKRNMGRLFCISQEGSCSPSATFISTTRGQKLLLYGGYTFFRRGYIPARGSRYDCTSYFCTNCKAHLHVDTNDMITTAIKNVLYVDIYCVTDWSVINISEQKIVQPPEALPSSATQKNDNWSVINISEQDIAQPQEALPASTTQKHDIILAKTTTGGTMLVLDGYTFSKNGTRKNYTRFACSKILKQCKAFVDMTQERNILRANTTHNHNRPYYMINKNAWPIDTAQTLSIAVTFSPAIPQPQTQTIPWPVQVSSDKQEPRKTSKPPTPLALVALEGHDDIRFIKLQCGVTLLLIKEYSFYKIHGQMYAGGFRWQCTGKKDFKCILVNRPTGQGFIFRGHMFYRHFRIKNGFRWRCSKFHASKPCKAYLHLSNSNIVTKANLEHCHPYPQFKVTADGVYYAIY
ncbi:unnamed protein product [Diatraea saccharalis]|uniref:FLYWCH-type domain-containing protein n=1 Tax=Diatraea saccharalis TaxID=40085 RepID=A0A9N9R1D5_9NEOP|nr:unnamed protein product [Diatraea saccharalis]